MRSRSRPRTARWIRSSLPSGRTSVCRKTDADEQVFPQWEVLGWYSVGTTLPQQHAAIQQQVEVLTPAPIVLVLDPSQAACAKANEQGTLPFTAYEPQGTDLVPCTLALGTAPVERVVLNDANSRALNTSDDAAAPGADHAGTSHASHSPCITAGRARRYTNPTGPPTGSVRIRRRRAARDIPPRRPHPAHARSRRREPGQRGAPCIHPARIPRTFSILTQIHEDAALTTYLADLTTNLHHLHELVEASAFHAPRARGV